MHADSECEMNRTHSRLFKLDITANAFAGRYVIFLFAVMSVDVTKLRECALATFVRIRHGSETVISKDDDICERIELRAGSDLRSRCAL